MARSATSPLVGYLLHGPLPPADLAALHDALGQHTPTLEPDPPDGCWLDLRGGRRAPSPARRGEQILASAEAWGDPPPPRRVAPTPGVARLAAQVGPHRLSLLDRGSALAFLAAVPLGATGVGAEIVDRLAVLGLHTLGAIAALERGRLGDYLGSLGPALEALARAEDDRPLVPARPPLILTARRDLDYALDDHAALASLVTHLLTPLLTDLRQKALGVTRAELHLLTGTARAIVTTVRLRVPTIDPGEVLRPLLAALPAGEDGDEETSDGVTTVLVTLIAPRPLVSVQASIFDVPQGRRGLLAQGVAEARRRGDGTLGYFQPADVASPHRAQRYTLVEEVVSSADRVAAT
jgi:hypothetical protein